MSAIFPQFNQSLSVPPELISSFLLQQQRTNYLLAVHKEQEYLQFINQLQILNLQNEIRNSSFLQSLQNAQYQQQDFKIDHLPSGVRLNLPLQRSPLQSYDETPKKSYSLDTSPYSEPKKSHFQDPNLELKTQISHMLNFFINKFDKVSHEEVSQQKSLIASNPVLLKLFDKLVQRYSVCGKSREDMVRSVLRGVLRFLKDSYRVKFNLSSKAASIKLCQKYFRPEDMENGGIDFEDEDQVLSFLLPYKKNSRNKTPNSRFITEIFASEEFRQDYQEYLENYDKAFKEENNKKIVRFIEFLLKCVQDGNLEKVRKYKRLPWLKTWQEATKTVAFELLDRRLQNILNKKVQEKEIRKQLKC